MSLPIPRFGRRRVRCNHLDMTVRSAPANFLIQQGTHKYHLIKIDLSDHQYDQDIVKALDKVYSDYRGRWWRWISSNRLTNIRYVKASPLGSYRYLMSLIRIQYSSYSETVQCFTAIEGVNRVRFGSEEWKRVIHFPETLRRSLHRGHTIKQDVANGPPMHEGHALFLEEERPDTSFGRQFVVFVVWFMATVIRALYNRNLELVLNTVNWGAAL